MGREEEEINSDNNDVGVKVEDAEEGEISDTASVEEISEEDFNKQEAVVTVDKAASTNKETTIKQKEQGNGNGRVWTMSDLYRYQMGGGYVSGLYNLAWAQAVQSKPGKSSNKALNELLVEVDDLDENSKRSSPSSSVASVNSKDKVDDEEKKKVDVDKVVIDVSGDEMADDDGNNNNKIVDFEKEEGELEEGEIDLDFEPAEKVNNGNAGVSNCNDDKMNADRLQVVNKEIGLEKKVNEIRDALESMAVSEANESFGAVCSKLCNTLDSLREVVHENNVPIKDDLKQVSLTAVRAIHSVFSSMSYRLREQYNDSFSRVLSLVNSCVPSIFTTEHAEEIQAMPASRDSSGVLSSISGEQEKEMFISNMVNKKDNDVFGKSSDHQLNTMNKLPTCSSANNKVHMSLDFPKTGASTFRSRGVMLPLLDLHKDHDADSLPSPTREAAPPVPVQRILTPKLMVQTENSRIHPYESDALVAVSSYQQKFSGSSFALTDRLPSPTPSEESGDGDTDVGGEVSSLSALNNFQAANTPNLGQVVASIYPPCTDGSVTPEVIPFKSSVPVSSVPSVTAKSSAKSRDPRLRFVSSDSNALDTNHRTLPVVNPPEVDTVGGAMNLKRQQPTDDLTPNNLSIKRQRNASENSVIVGDVKNMVGSGGWLEDSDIIEPQTMSRNQLVDSAESGPMRKDSEGACPSTGSGISSASISGNEQILVTRTRTAIGDEQLPVMGASAASIPDLLKNIAVNPTMLINILKIGHQQRLASETQQKPVEAAISMGHPPNSNSTVGTVPVMSTTPPRSSRILSRPAGAVQVPAHLSTPEDLGKIRMKPRDPRRVLHNNLLQRNGSMGSEQLKTNVTSSLVNQETQDDQNLQKQGGQVEMKPVLSQPLAPPDISMPFTKKLKNIADILSVSNVSTSLPLVAQNLASQPMLTTTSNSDLSVVGPTTGLAAGPRPHNAWGDVVHLFEGYNDQQKAAIQRERARRIDEQKKLFSARKLCLVLDLDHTLLNSAKFVEVDPVHDEILRKKEEQDREKPQRHLFRFPHMGLWTKLRPGIWNFLEKASKLYELHLYTMGNKLYATEMAKVLDPKGVLFNGRVISRGDDGDPFDGDERVPKSKDLEGVLGLESSVVIIDDSVRVWPHNKLSLIVVERYIFFPCSRRQFGLPGPSLLEIDHDERPEDGTLACALAVIERIHQNFFSHPSLDDADVRNILASEQRKILAGCRIVFSRVFPVGEAKPHLHPLWQTAEQFGAVCTNQIDEQVTHVVANSLGTDKVNWALSTGKFVVYPGWVEASALLYRRANEQDFAVKP